MIRSEFGSLLARLVLYSTVFLVANQAGAQPLSARSYTVPRAPIGDCHSLAKVQNYCGLFNASTGYATYYSVTFSPNGRILYGSSHGKYTCKDYGFFEARFGGSQKNVWYGRVFKNGGIASGYGENNVFGGNVYKFTLKPPACQA